MAMKIADLLAEVRRLVAIWSMNDDGDVTDEALAETWLRVRDMAQAEYDLARQGVR